MRSNTSGTWNIVVETRATEDSPQAYAMESYYFIHDGEYFVLSFNDAAKPEAEEIYDCFLSEFETL